MSNRVFRFSTGKREFPYVLVIACHLGNSLELKVRLYFLNRFFSIGLFCAACTVAFPAIAEIGTVRRVTGSAVIERGGKPMPMASGTKLMQGDVIATGKDGRASVTFVDFTRMSIDPNSRIALSKFDFDSENRAGQFLTRVDRGTLAIISGDIAKSKRNAMKVRTPTQLIGVIGTCFVVEVP